MLRAEPNTGTLTEFERDCRDLALRGRTPEQIAEQLVSTKGAVMQALHLSRRKLGGYETKGG